jgi:hypothetical protein
LAFPIESVFIAVQFIPRPASHIRSLNAPSSDSLGVKTYKEAAWDHLARIGQRPFRAGEQRRALEALDDRGNELMAVKDKSVTHYANGG